MGFADSETEIQIITRRIKCPFVSEGKGRKEIRNRNVYDPAGRGFVLQEPPLLRLFDRGPMFSTNRYVTLKKTWFEKHFWHPGGNLNLHPRLLFKEEQLLSALICARFTALHFLQSHKGVLLLQQQQDTRGGKVLAGSWKARAKSSPAGYLDFFF